MRKKKKKIMVVEDDSIVAESVIYLLKKYNYLPVGPFTSAREAIKGADENRPDLVLMDINLKGKMEGVTAAEEIHKRYDIPIIFTTAYATDEVLEKARLSSPYSYILKPFSENELKSNIEMALFKHEQEQKARGLERKWQGLFSFIKEIIIITDQEGNLLEMNPYGLESLRIRKNDLKKSNLANDIYEYPEDWVQQRKELFRNDAFSGYTQRLRKTNGELLDVISYGYTLRNRDGEIEEFIFIFTDVTRIKQLERNIFQSQKMESLGNLASGIAHDFNNILSAIMGYSQMGAMVTEEPQLKKYFSNIEKAANKAAHLTRQILAFARKQEIQFQQLDVNQFLKDNYEIYRRLIPENIDLTLNLHDEPLVMFCDQNCLEQIVLNLIVNARDAISNSGKIVITTTRQELQEEDLNFQEGARTKAGEYLCISIRDNGAGIPEDIREKIFEPFFTTKPEGKGTGLGLSVVLGLVEQMKGLIRLDSTPGEGTEFRLYFPLAEKEKTEEEKAESIKLLKGTGTILLAEDEEDILRMTKWMLLTLGYDVITAKDGQEALQHLLQQQGKVDLILTDVIMPQLTGFDLLKEVKNRNLDIPVRGGLLR